ncbi:hypothetical protein B296_00023764 [Ensete ventricosum]|uniref:Uncharacterized protein n=1 Tax=Ensete ventricosum TaxID=4639 RepID=A0A426ZGU2_ENSVE|nr:hypothetical protein B296_00023764 [Ensete ventricosum]
MKRGLQKTTMITAPEGRPIAYTKWRPYLIDQRVVMRDKYHGPKYFRSLMLLSLEYKADLKRAGLIGPCQGQSNHKERSGGEETGHGEGRDDCPWIEGEERGQRRREGKAAFTKRGKQKGGGRREVSGHKQKAGDKGEEGEKTGGGSWMEQRFIVA